MSLSVKKFPARRVDDYDRIRPEIRSGDILMCAGSGWFSKMIQRATGSVWSHVAFIMRLEPIDRVMVLESVEPIGVRTVPLRKYLVDYDSKGNAYPGGLVLIRHRQLEKKSDSDTLQKFGQFAVDLFGYPYDRYEIAKIAARIASAKIPFSREEQKELQPDREYICSEYVWECYREIGIRIKHDPKGFVAPSDFAAAPDMELTHVLKRR